MPSNDMLTPALEYAAMGWPIFPCRENNKSGRAKAPYIKNGFKDATTDPAKISEWWVKWPKAMIGVPTGPISGFWVLDIDNSNGKDGTGTLSELEKKNCPLPETIYQETARGGRHMLFNWTDGVRNRGAFAPGLDVRGDGGYIILSPSYWDEEGDYTWINPPHENELADAPYWLIQAVIQHTKKPSAPPAPYNPRAISSGTETPYYAKVLAENALEVSSCTPGNQNETLYKRSVRIGSFVAGGGIDEKFAISEMTRAGMTMALGDTHDPWTQEVIEDIVTRGIEFGKHSPNVAPERIIPSRPQLKVVGGQEKPETDYAYQEGYPEQDWRSELQYKPDGLTLVEKDIGNMRLQFIHHEDFLGGLKFNEFSLDVEIGKVPWKKDASHRPVKDEDFTHAREWLQRHGLKPSVQEARDALVIAAGQHPYNPVRDYLQSLQWDGTERADFWLQRMMGVEDSPYARAISPKVLISAVARIMVPGCQVDTVLILEGPQGLKKSSAIQALFGRDWTSEATNLFSQQSKMVLLMTGAWAIELAEFSAVLTADEKISKGLITTRIDDVVLPYARTRSKHKRQCIMIGTMNPNDTGYLKDLSGNRRYWPAACTKINLADIASNRDQLWAEAYHKYIAGERWWLDENETDLAFNVQTERQSQDPWADVLEPKISHLSAIEPSQAMDVLEIAIDKRDKRVLDRVCAVLRTCGFDNKLKKIDGKVTRAWRRVT